MTNQRSSRKWIVLWISSGNRYVNDCHDWFQDRPAQFMRDFFRRRHAHAARTQRFGQSIEGNRAQRTGDRLAELADVSSSRDLPPPIVCNDSGKWQFLPRGAFDIGDVERKRAVTGEQDDRAVWISQPCCHGTANAPADDAASSARQPITRVTIAANQLMRPLPNTAAVDQQDWIFLEHLPDGADNMQRVQSAAGLLLCALLNTLPEFVAPACACREPCLPCAPILLAADRRERIPTSAERENASIAPNRGRLQISYAIVNFCARHQNAIRVAQNRGAARRRANHAKKHWAGVIDGAAIPNRSDHRNLAIFTEPKHIGASIVVEEPTARDDQRRLGTCHRANDFVKIGVRRSSARVNRGGWNDRAIVHFAVLDVHGKHQVHRSRRIGKRLFQGFVENLCSARGTIDGTRKLGDGLGQRYLIGILKVPQPCRRNIRRAADEQQGTIVEPRIHYARQGVHLSDTA